MHHLHDHIATATARTDRDVARPDLATTPRDGGSTLLELLVVIVVLGVLTGIVLVAVTGMKSQAAESSCAADRRQLLVAAEAYFVQREADMIPATGSDHDRYERTLVADGFLRAASDHYDLDADGVTTTEANTPC